MVLVVDLDGTPWVTSAADVATVRGLNNLVGANNGEGDLALHNRNTYKRVSRYTMTMVPLKEKARRTSYHDILGLVDGLNVIAVVVLSMINLDVVVGNIQENLMSNN